MQEAAIMTFICKYMCLLLLVLLAMDAGSGVLASTPSAVPTVAPSSAPTVVPTVTPSAVPSAVPSAGPSAMPTFSPSASPSNIPTAAPSQVPTSAPHPDDPHLLFYTLDCSSGKLVMTFDSLVSALTMDISGIGFQSVRDITVANVTTTTVQLTTPFNNLPAQGNTTELVIYLNADDFSLLKFSSPVASSISSTYLTLRRDSVFTPFNKANVEVNSSAALPATSYKGDNFPPYVERFTLNMDAGRLRVRFTEPVDADSFELDGLTIQKRAYMGEEVNDPVLQSKIFLGTDLVFTPTLATELVRLVNNHATFISSTEYDRIIEFDLGITNTNHIKAIIGLATSYETTFLSAWKPFVNDTSGNAVSITGFDQLHGLPVLTYYPDETPPTLLYWDFNLNTGIGEIVFSETVYMIFFNFSAVVFTNSPNCSVLGGINSTAVLYQQQQQQSLLTSGTANCSALRLQSPLDTPQNNTDKVRFTLSEAQLNEVKAMPELLSTKDSSFLILEPRVVVDTSAAQNRYEGLDATVVNPRPVRVYSPDSTDPRLLSFSLDLSTRTLLLLFSETVKLSSLQLAAASLQSELTAGVETEIFSLSTEAVEVLTTGDSLFLEFRFTTSAFAQLKSFSSLATSIDTTFISASREFIADRSRSNPNQLEEVASSAALQAAIYIPDTIPPQLQSWYPDFSLNQIHLSFSKPVDFPNMRIELMNLTSDVFRISSTEDFSPSELSYLLSFELTDAVIQLSEQDGIELRAFDFLCGNIDSCFLSLPATFASDTLTINSTTGESASLPLQPVVLLAPRRFIVDSIAPLLLNVSVDMNLQQLTFVFSEFMDVTSLNVSSIVLFTADASTLELMDPITNITTYYNASQQLLSHRLSPFAFSNDIIAKTVVVQLTRADFIAIQLATPLATAVEFVNVSITSKTLSDNAGNQFNASSELFENGGVRPFEVINDVTSPKLRSIYLRTTSSGRNLTLYFDEVVNINSVQLAQFLLISSSGATVDLFRAEVVDPTVSSFSDNVLLPSSYITLQLNPIASELEEFGLAEDQASTFIYIAAAGAITDVSPARNRIQSMSSSAAIRDGVIVTAFHLDMLTKTLLLELSFYVELATLVPSRFTLRSTIGSLLDDAEEETAVVSYTFRKFSSFEIDAESAFVVIHLSEQDFISLRGKFTVADRSDIVLDVSSFAARDVNGKRLAASATVPCAHFVRDSTELLLENYRLDLGLGTLRLNFNKEIQLSTVDVMNDALSLHINRNVYQFSSNASAIVLRNISVIEEPDLFNYLAPNTTTLLLSLNNQADVESDCTACSGSGLLTVREEILLLYPLASTVSTTFLSVRRGMSFDLSRPRNPLQGIEISSALSPQRLTIDKIPPSATSFTVDLDARLLTVTFSEAVNMSTVLPAKFKFLMDPGDPDSISFFPRADSPVLSVLPGPVVQIELLKLDIYALMLMSATGLLQSAGSTYLSLLPGAVKDLATVTTISAADGIVIGGNPSAETLHRYALPVASYTSDTTAPNLLWYNFSLQTGAMVMFFDEMINCSAVRPELIRLQYREFTGTSDQYYHLSSSTVVDCSSLFNRLNEPIDLYVYFTLDVEDLVNLKIFTSLAKTADLLYLRLLSGAVSDISGNGNAAMIDGMAMAPTRFIPDTVSPKLLSFLVNAQHQLTLFFNEPVDPASINVREMWLQNSRSDSTRAYPLIKAELFRVDEQQMQLEYNFIDDFYRIYTDSEIFHKQGKTYLRASAATVVDMSGNAMVEIPRDNTIQLGPSVNYWDLDIESGIIQFKWNEAVDNTFSFVQSLSGEQDFHFILQDSATVNNYTLALTTSSQFEYSPDDASILFVKLSKSDINNLKNTGLLGRRADLFLAVTFGVSRSINGGDVIPNLRTVEVRTTDALPIRRYSPDRTRPVCSSFNLNLNSGLLILNFDEPTNPQSLVLSDFVLFTESTGSFVQLTAAVAASLVNSTQLQVNLSAADLRLIKDAVRRDSIPLDSLVMKRNAVTDIVGNGFIGNTPDNPIPLAVFTPDSTPPVLLMWSLDLSTYQLLLYFDERIDTVRTTATSFTLFSGANQSDPALQSLQLSDFSIVADGVTAADDEMVLVLVYLDVYRQDAYAVQAVLRDFVALNKVAGNYSTSLPYLQVSGAVDLFGNVNDSPNFLLVSDVEPDVVPLNLEAFDFEFNNANTFALVTLYFSRTVPIANFSCADFKFRSEASVVADSVVQIEEDDCTALSQPFGGHTVRFKLPATLFTASGGTIGQSQSSTYINVPLESSNTASLAGNPLQAIHPSGALRVGPQLVSFSFDVNTGVVAFVFNKPVDISQPVAVSTFGFFSGVTQQLQYLKTASDSNSSATTISLTSYSGRINSTVVELQLSDADLVALKLLDIASDKFFAAVASDAMLSELSGDYRLNEINKQQRLRAALLILDDEPPLLQYIALDMGTEQLLLQFDEPIRISTLQLTNLRLQAVADINTIGIGDNYFELTGGTATAVTSTTVKIQLTNEDAATLKLRVGLADNQTSTYLSFPYFTAYDYAGNALPAIASSVARPIDAFINDTVPPTLDAYVFDLSTAGASFLTFVFSEPVLPLAVMAANSGLTIDNPRFVLSDLILQSRFASRDGVAYRLQGGSIVDISLNNVTVLLLESDVANMKRTFGLIRNRQSTYLVLNANFTSDLAGNAVIPFRDGAAFRVTEYIADRAAPLLLSSTLDLDAGTITFVANEPIRLGTVDPSALTVQFEVITNSQQQHTLGALTTAQDADSLSETVVLLLSQADQNEIKVRFPLAGSRENTWFSYFPSLLEDTSGNPLARVYKSRPVQATFYNADITPPAVIYYALDMNIGRLRLIFSEAISTSSIDLNQLIIQDVPTRRFGSYVVLNYTAVSVGTGAQSNDLLLTLDNSTLAFMKIHGIGLTAVSSYLSWSNVFVSDTSGNFLEPYWDDSVYQYSPRVPDSFVEDGTGPLLLRWYCYRQSDSSSSSRSEELAAVTCLLFFDESVSEVGASAFTVYYSRVNSKGKISTFDDSYALVLDSRNASITYSKYNRLITLQLPNYCAGADGDTLSSSCNGDTLYSFLNRDATTATSGSSSSSNAMKYFIALKSTAAVDFARTPNSAQQLRPRFALEESEPDCSTCDDGEYISTNCTATSDRVCSACTTCRQGTYTQQSCQLYHNTNCAVCGSCGLHKYISSPCSTSSDTSCLPCTECGGLQYTLQRCELGIDAVCRSCEQCTFPATAEGQIASRICSKDKKYFFWQQANCCEDRNGSKIPCKESDRQRILETAIDGRHHWTFPDSTPKIDVVRNPGIRFPKQY